MSSTFGILWLSTTLLLGVVVPSVVAGPLATPLPYEAIGSVDVGTLESSIFLFNGQRWVLGVPCEWWPYTNDLRDRVWPNFNRTYTHAHTRNATPHNANNNTLVPHHSHPTSPITHSATYTRPRQREGIFSTTSSADILITMGTGTRGSRASRMRECGTLTVERLWPTW